MGTVCASPLLGCLVDLDVLDDQVAGVETLGVGVGLGVLEEREEELAGLDWPAGPGNTEFLAWSVQMLVIVPCILTAVPFLIQQPHPSYVFQSPIRSSIAASSRSILISTAIASSYMMIHPPNPPQRSSKIQLTLSSSSSTTSIPPHWNSLLMVLDILEVGKRLLELPAVDGLGGFAGVLEGDTEVRASRACRFGGRDFCRCVSDL